MDGSAKGKPVPAFLWEDRGVVPFLKVDKGLEAEKPTACSLMKPIPGLDALLERAVKLGIFGTKMRSVITGLQAGIAAIVKQQFELGRADLGHGLMPIIEPEVSIKSPDKRRGAILRAEMTKTSTRLPAGRKVMLKLTIPTSGFLRDR